MKILNRSNFLRICVAVLLLFASLAWSCSPATLEGSLTKTVIGARTVREVVTIQYRFGRITPESYRAKIDFFTQFYKDIDALGDALGDTISDENRATVLEKVDSLIAAVNTVVADGGAGFKNAESRAAFNNGVLLLRSGLKGLRAVAATANGKTPASVKKAINDLKGEFECYRSLTS